MYLKCVHLASAFIHTYIEELSKTQIIMWNRNQKVCLLGCIKCIKVLFFPFTLAVRAQKAHLRWGEKALKTLNTCELVIRDRDRH